MFQKMKRNRFLAFAICAIFLIACSRGYTFYAFTYPPDNVPHENNWEYFGKIAIWDSPGKEHNEKGNKRIVITIVDVRGSVLLDDTFNVDAGTIEREITWNEHAYIKIDLYECPDGERKNKETWIALKSLEYRYDNNARIYAKIET